MPYVSLARLFSKGTLTVLLCLAVYTMSCHSQQRSWGSAKLVTDSSRSVSDAVITAPFEKPISIHGTVRSVCPDDGCWMLIEDGANALRVELPTDEFAAQEVWSKHEIIVEGILERKIVASNSPGYTHYKESCEQGTQSAIGMNQATILRAYRAELR